MAVIVYLYVATALFLSRPAYAGGALVAATALAVLTAYLIDRARRTRRQAARGEAAATAEPAGAGTVRIPRQRTAPERRVPERDAA